MGKCQMALTLVFALASCQQTELKVRPSDSDLQFTDLATVWDEAMPLGNATLGCLVWQREEKLRFSLDRTDLWDLRPAERYQGDHFSFDWVRKHIRERDYAPVIDKFERTAGSVAPSKIPGAALEFDSEGWGPVTASRLFLNDALCQVGWENGTRLQTFIQADRPVGWFVFRNVAEDFHLQLVPPAYQSGQSVGNGGLGDTALDLLGYEQGEVTQEGDFITYHQKGWADFYYDVAVGWQRKGNDIVGAWSITSSLVGENAADEVKRALGQGVRKAYSRHLDYWQPYWSQSVVCVPDTVVQRQYDREMYKFGSASRKDSYPISLQAVWTADDGRLPPWKGDYHHDLNTQLSYWPAYTGNHLDEGLAYINTLWNQRPVHKAFTRKFFGKDGLDVPGTCALDGHAIGGWVQYSMSQTTSAWLAQHFYLHWKYSADREFLAERGYPYLRDVAVFLEQQSEVDEQGVRRLEWTSSPEINDNRLEAWFPDFTNYDLALTSFAFLAAGEMADSLGLNDEAAHWKQAEAQLPHYALDEKGALLISPSTPLPYSHRHFSHAMAIHPLGLLDVSHGDAEKRIIDATLDQLYEYGPDYWCGYSYSWLANLEARALHGEKACEALRTFAQCFCLRNSFHANGDQSRSGKSRFLYRPFTLEGNFAFASGLQEMLLQSHAGIINVFPAIPEKWEDVSFERLRTVGAFLVSAEKRGGEVTSLSVDSEKGGRLRIRHPKTGEIIERETKPGEKVILL
ncbi:MAG: glycoside hydrolase family 95 protein [Bacteroidaceae bacterium]|nr:glycoside hydrolase family 95 protein [Bacteroidaceae bacterium]